MEVKGISGNLWVWRERFARDGLATDWLPILEQCAEAGLDAIELSEEADVADLASRFGLGVSAAYIGLPLHEHDLDETIRRWVLPLAEKLAQAGGKDLIINADPKGSWASPQRKTADEFRRQGEHLTRIAELVAPLGLRTSLHNHAADRHNAEGDLHSVVRFASDSVGLCVDTGWAHTAGHDPLDWIAVYPDRIFAVHLRNQSGAIPTEDLTTGDLDMAEFLRYLREADYGGWLTLELWHPEGMQPTGSMRDAVKRSVDWLADRLNG